MEDMIGRLKGSAPAQGCSEVLYPGELEVRNAMMNREQGVALPPAVMQELSKLACELDVAFPSTADFRQPMGTAARTASS